MISKDTPYKLAEIIQDTWPQLYYLKKENKNGSKHTKSPKEGVGSMSLTTGLKETVSFLLAGLDFFFFPLLTLLLGVGLLGLLSSRVGILTGWQVPILRVQTFLLRQFLLQQMLWVILLCFSGVLKLRGISSGGANLEGFGPLLLSTVPLL